MGQQAPHIEVTYLNPLKGPLTIPKKVTIAELPGPL